MADANQSRWDPEAVLARAGSSVVALCHHSPLAWPSTWVLVAALALAPGAGPSTDAGGSMPVLPSLSSVEIPMSNPILLPAAIELASPFQESGAFPLTLPRVEPDPIADGLPVTITAYVSEVGHTDDEPFVTASGRLVRPGTLALSRDLLRTFTPDAPFDFGDKVRLGKYGQFVVDDTMNSRWTRRVDIWLPTSDEAQEFGVRRGRLYLLGARGSTAAGGATGRGSLDAGGFLTP